MHRGLRPATRHSYDRQLKLYLAFCWFLEVDSALDIHCLLAFMQYLVDAELSSQTIANYISAIKYGIGVLGLSIDIFSDIRISKMLRGIKLQTRAAPALKSVITIDMLHKISQSCDILHHSRLFRAIFMVAFFSFLRISNFAVTKPSQFDASRHFLVKDFVNSSTPFLLVKWEKNLQLAQEPRVVHLPVIPNSAVCPVTALRKLRSTNSLPNSAPLFAFPDALPVQFNQIRNALSQVLQHVGLPPNAFTFHSFRRSGATLAFNSQVPLSLIKAHGGWRSNAVLRYLHPDASTSKAVSNKFQNLFK